MNSPALCKRRKAEHPLSLYEKLTAYPVLLYVSVLLFFTIFAFLANWSLLTGDNLMKYDIWDAEYPAQVIMSDAIAGGTIPMWNPLMQFGTPYYAVIGMPVWYPLTLLLAFFGFSPTMLAVEYVIHLIIGAFGMFLLAKEQLKPKEGVLSPAGLCASIAAGLIYGASGLFLSNASHIMIIISAAWIPFVFYYAKRYLNEKRLYFAMMAGLCAGFLIVGGYPELFYNLFLVLIPYMLCVHYRTNKGFFSNVWASAKRYLLICVFTVLSCAVTLIPFLCSMNHITRGNGLGERPIEFFFSEVLSTVFPKTAQLFSSMESTMLNFYMSLLVILTIPAIIIGVTKNKKLYLGLTVGSFILCWGPESFLHAFFYKFFPMYQSFRFASVSRVFVVIFLLLLAVQIWRDFLESKQDDKVLRFSKVLLCITGACAVFFAIAAHLTTPESGLNAAKCVQFSEAAFLTTFLLALYVGLWYAAKNKQIAGKTLQIVFICVVCTELIVFSYAEGPITIMRYKQNDYLMDHATNTRIDYEFDSIAGRTRSIDFSGNRRSTSGLNSQYIAVHKTFDEEGYLSFLLQKQQNYGHTYNRSIIAQNPVAYFTNDVVTKEQVEYADWCNSPAVSPQQIFAEKSIGSQPALEKPLEAKVTSEQDLPMEINGKQVFLVVSPETTTAATDRIRLFFDARLMTADSVKIEVAFAAGEAKSVYHDQFPLHKSKGSCYVDLYYPREKTPYDQVTLTMEGAVPVSAKAVVAERMTQDAYVDVDFFGFNSITMNVDAPTEGYLTLLQTKYAGWNAYVDGEKAEIDEINNCFMGIHVQPGKHRVIMKFRPLDFFLGAGITLLYYLALCIVAVVYVVKKHRRESVQ